MNYLRPTIFAIVMLLYLWYPYTMIKGQEQILKDGTAYRFKPRPVDPVDAFRGRYILLSYEGLNITYPNAENTFTYGQTLYLTLAKDDQGYAYFSGVQKKIPDSVDYLVATCAGLSVNKVMLNVPENMSRYFLNEAIAPEAERFYNEMNRGQITSDSVFVFIDTKVKDGKILLEQLYFKDLPVEEYVRSMMRK